MTKNDPTAIRSLAVSPEDVADAYVYSRENPGEAVLRVTPPFHGRMRARIHVYRVDDAELTGAVHLQPEVVIADEICADYPRHDPNLGGEDPIDAERTRERRAEALEAWHDRASEAIVDEVALETDDGPHRVELKRLG